MDANLGNVDWIPIINMPFDSETDAYEFYSAYAERTGFFVRRSTLWTTTKNIVTRRTFVCSREGFREKKKGSSDVRAPRPETRVGCEACMTIRLAANGKYRVSEFIAEHNHPFATNSTSHLLKAKKMRQKTRLVRADLVDDTVKTPEFENEDEAYEFYNMYAGKLGFRVRRASMTTSTGNVVTRRMFVCSREGFREKKKGAKRVRKPRPETRTGCPACMVIRITAEGKYHVSEFVTYHNHQLAVPSLDETGLLSGSENGMDMEDEDLGESSAVVPKRNDDPIKSGRVRPDISPRPIDDNDNPRSKILKGLQMGDVGSILEYLQSMQGTNPSFFYAIQADDNGRMTNFFWADAKSIMDFNYFSDVVCFNTAHKLNGYGRPFAFFTGLNHHKQAIIFGAAFLFHESVDSFKWLFETFKTAMCGKQPKTILTDRSPEISDAVAESWTGTAHRFCVWHIYLNAVEQISQVFHGSKTLSYDFGRCLFDYEDEEEFLSAWKNMLEKYDLKDNQWLIQLFDDKEKWALVYGRDAFYADMKSVQQNDNLYTKLKKCFNPEMGLPNFFEHYEKMLDEQRRVEMQADVYALHDARKLPSVRILKQATNVYTPAAYKMFEREFEMCMDCMVFSCGDIGTVSEYKVMVEENPVVHFVRFDSLDGSVICSCKKFEFVGIQCRHVLKVLDSRNIKELPLQYILKRWRKDAKASSMATNCEVFRTDDPMTPASKRNSYLFRIFCIAAARAAKTAESYAFLERHTDVLLEQVEQFLQTRPPELPSLTAATSYSHSENAAGRINQSSFQPCSSNGLLSGSRHLQQALCWGQFPAGPPEQ